MGERLRLARVERGYTKAALARLSNLSPRAIGKIESGGQSGIDVIEDLAKVLTTSPAWLAFNQGPREVPRRRLANSNATPLRTLNA
jgi:transcriptional regulator with XRE-family HTH domain